MINGSKNSVHTNFVKDVTDSSISNNEPVVETARRNLNFQLGAIITGLSISKYTRPVVTVPGIYLSLVNKRKTGELRVFFNYKVQKLRFPKKIKRGTNIYE